MRAAVVSEYGTPGYAEFAEPEAGQGQRVIEVAAAGINPVDLAKAAGTFYSGRQAPPFVAGGEGVGTLVGDGRRVYFDRPVEPYGSMAERSLVRADNPLDVPDELDDDLAVAIGVAGLAAWLPLEWRARLQPGETVLVLGATGIVGQIAVQAAKLLGAARVVAAGRDQDALRRVAGLGADATVGLDVAKAPAAGEAASHEADADAARADLATAFREAAGGEIDVVIDPLWGAPAVAAIDALTAGGRLIQIGQSAGVTATVPSALVRGKLVDIRGHTNFLAPPEVKAGAYARLAEHAAAGRIVVETERIPLADVEQAWARQRDGAQGRKLVLVP